MNTRAYSVLEVKEIDDDARIIRGIATTPTTDRVDDIVEPLGAQFTLPLPLLAHHDKRAPIGWVEKATPTKKGIEIVARLAKITEPGALKDAVDRAWQEIKYKLVRGLSIGFKPLEVARIEGSFGSRFTKWDWLELSTVTIPANAEANIVSVKEFAEQERAALGQITPDRDVSAISPGASGSRVVKSITTPKGASMNIQEQIRNFQNARAAKVAALQAVMQKSVESGLTLNDEQKKEHDDLAKDIGEIDEHLKRLEDFAKLDLAGAAPVAKVEPGTKDAEHSKGAILSRDPASRVIAVEKKLPPGVGFARLAGCIAAAKGNRQEALQIARERFPEEKQIHGILDKVRLNDHNVIKAAVDIGTTLDTDWAAPLVNYQNLVNEFLEYLRPRTILDQVAPRTTRVPFNVRVPRQTGGGAASWVGEGAPKPVTSFAFDFVTLGYMKLAAIAVITQELARFSSPNADTVVRDQLAKAIIQQMDADFVDPANAGTTNVKPASITNGVTAVPSGGVTYSDVLLDIQNVHAPFIAANMSARGAVWIMSETTALALSLMRLPANEGGGMAFPGMTAEGGTFQGRPVVVSEAVGNIVILAQASDILLADDGQVTIDSSDQASLQMDSAPTNPVVATTVLISLWQQNLLGIRAERFVTWVKGRSSSVQYLSGVNWGQAVT